MGQKQTPVMELDKTIGEILKEAAKAQQKSLRTLEEKTEISHSRIGQAFRGEKALTTGETDKLCLALGLSPWAVIRLAEARFRKPNYSYKIVAIQARADKDLDYFDLAAKHIGRPRDGHTTEYGYVIDDIGEENQDVE